MPKINEKAFSEMPNSFGSISEYLNVFSNYNQEILKSIIKTAKFYINHIPTYKGNLKTEFAKEGSNYKIKTRYENELALNHLSKDLKVYNNAQNEYFIPNTIINDLETFTYTVKKDKNEYSEDKKIKTIYRFTDKYPIGQNENPINRELDFGARRYKKREKSENKSMYQNGNGNDENGFTMGYYKWKEYIDSPIASISESNTEVGNANEQNNKPFAGGNYVKDDCSGFALLVYNLVENENLLEDGIDFNSDKLLYKTEKLPKVLFDKGYEMYKCDDNGKWKRYTKDNTKGEDVVTMGINFLKPGDLLVCSGHVEYYVGAGFNVTYIDEDAPNIKKTGISEIKVDLSKYQAPKNNVAYGTFGWGSVIDEFPIESKDGNPHYFYYDNKNHFFKHCMCGKGSTDSSAAHKGSGCMYGERQYKVVWRKK